MTSFKRKKLFFIIYNQKCNIFKGGVNRYIELKTEVYLYNYSTILSNFLKNKSFNDVNSKTINIHKIKLHNMFLLTLHFIEIFKFKMRLQTLQKKIGFF